MTTFLIAAGALALLGALFIVRPMLTGAGEVESRDTADARVFRDQLEEVERDRMRGAISAAEAEGAKAEISRRLIRAVERGERQCAAGSAPKTTTRLVAGLTLLAAPLIGSAVYLATGAPGLPDLPLAARTDPAAMTRLSQAEAEAEVETRMADAPVDETPRLPDEYVALIKRLEGIVAERQDDAEGNRLLANAYMQMERYAEAWPVWRRLIRIRGEEAPPELYLNQAEAMILASGGYVSPEAETVLAEALARDPNAPIGRYYVGLAAAQRGDLPKAIATWNALLAEATPDTSWLPVVRAMLAEAVRVRDGEDAPSTSAPGPTAEDMAAAEQMSSEERAAMIEGMVGQLEARLSDNGGEPEEFLRLINAYRTLGREEDAQRVYEMSQDKLEGSAASFVREQALVMGLVTE